MREVRPSTHLDPQHQVSVGVLHLPLPALQLLGPLLLPLQPPDVVHRGLQNGSLIPAHVSGGDSGDKDLQSESADQLTGTVQESFFFFLADVFEQFKDAGTCEMVFMVVTRKSRGGEKNQRTDYRTHGSFDFGIKVPSSLIRSLMLNLRLRSTGRKCFQLTAALIQARFACAMNKKK